MHTQETLKKYLSYDEESGYLFWKVRPNKRIKIGDRAGRNSKNGYRYITVNKIQIMEHRAIFIYKVGHVPKEIDHINHNRSDNRWINLRELSHRENCRHLKIDKRNSSGCNGVTLDSKNNKWYARINNNEGITLNLGLHKCKKTAITIRKAAEGWFWDAV